MTRRLTQFALVASLLLMCGAAYADGPLFGIWHIDGHGYRWQLAQIDAGLPIEPTIRMVPAEQRDSAGAIQGLIADAPLLKRLDGGPIVLRMNNIGAELDATIARISPLNDETWRHSHMCIRRLKDGTFEDVPTVCPLVGTDAWSLTGREWATSRWMRRLQRIIPNPTGVILRENNEAGRISFGQLYVRQEVRYLDEKGVLLRAVASTPAASYAEPPPSTPGIMYRVERDRVFAYYWKTDAELDALDLRVKEWVAPRRSSFPPDNLGDWTEMENAQYQSLYAAFDANLVDGWRGKLRTCGYGEYAENRQNDAASPAMYLGYYRDPDLTTPGAYAITRFDPGSEELIAEAANPKAWREYSISFMLSATFTGAQKGTHAAVDPESFAGFMSHVAWRLQAPGREVRLTYWDNAFTKPEHLVYAEQTNKKKLKQASIDAMTVLGRPDMLSLTVEDYELATLRALDRIHDDPTINRYWHEGLSLPLTSSLNTATSMKVYATETTIPGVQDRLVCVYTPCDLNGEIPVGDFAIPARCLSYWIVPEMRELP